MDGGLLGFPLLLLGPLRRVEATTRSKLLSLAVRRFSKVATVAVMVVAVTGAYAILLHLPGGHRRNPVRPRLLTKLGMVALLLPIGAINLIDRGRGPLGRMVGAELILAMASSSPRAS